MKPTTFTIILIIGLIMLLGLAVVMFDAAQKAPGQPPGEVPEEPVAVTNFEECAKQKNAVILESFPAQCQLPDGRSFREDIGNELEKRDLIRLDEPRPNTTVISPLTVRGEARGFWFFEASFPLRLLDGNGNVLVEHFATAQDEWMTEEFVPFAATIEFAEPDTPAGTLILEKDNPSGLPEHADELRVPVKFAKAQESSQTVTDRQRDGCIISGCGGEVCAEQEVVTTCEFRPEDACYKEAICERNAQGSCAWRQTSELTQCLSKL